MANYQGGMFPWSGGAGSNQFFPGPMPQMPAFNTTPGGPPIARNMSIPIGAGGNNRGGVNDPGNPPAGPLDPGGSGGGAPNPTSGGDPSDPTFNPLPTGPGGTPVPNGGSAFGWPNIPGTYAVPPQYPGLAGGLATWLQSQVGMGVPGFNQSTMLPGGGSTLPGQLTAMDNATLQQLQQFFATGKGGGPGMDFLSTIANQGVSALPQWQAMLAAQKQNIGQNEANIAGQFASMGDLAGSPFATAMTNFGEQTTLDQNALLANLTQSNIQNIQLPAAQGLFGAEQGFGQYQQGLNQQAIQNQYAEFIRTSPQYNPLISPELSMSGIYPPTVSPGSGLTSLGGLLAGAGTLAGGIGSIWNSAGNSGNCYLTSACSEAKGLPDDCYELQVLRGFRDDYVRAREDGQEVLEEYERTAPKIVSNIKKLGAKAQQTFDKIYNELVIKAVHLILSGQNDAAYSLYKNYTNHLTLQYGA